MAKLANQTIDKSDKTPSFSAAAAAGDTFDSFAGVFVEAKNANVGVTRTITISAVTDPIVTPEAGSLVVPDIVIVVPISGEKRFAVPPSHLSVAALASMTYSDEADLTLAVMHVQQ